MCWKSTWAISHMLHPGLFMHSTKNVMSGAVAVHFGEIDAVSRVGVGYLNLRRRPRLGAAAINPFRGLRADAGAHKSVRTCPWCPLFPFLQSLGAMDMRKPAISTLIARYALRSFSGLVSVHSPRAF